MLPGSYSELRMSSQERLPDRQTIRLASLGMPFTPLLRFGLFINIVAKAFFVHFSMPLGRRSFAKVIPAAVPGVIPGQRQLTGA